MTITDYLYVDKSERKIMKLLSSCLGSILLVWFVWVVVFDYNDLSKLTLAEWLVLGIASFVGSAIGRLFHEALTLDR